MKKIYVNFIFFSVLAGCGSHQDAHDVHELESQDVKLISTRQFSFTDYNQSDELDSKIAYSDSFFIIFNYELGHADFSAPMASLQIMRNGSEYSLEQLRTYVAEQRFQKFIDSLHLKSYSVQEFMVSQTHPLTHADTVALSLSENDNTSRFSALKFGNTLFQLTYSSEGVTEIHVLSPKINFKKVLSTELVPAPPQLFMRNICGDSKKELFVAYPCDDYWESRCFVLDILDVSDFM